MCSFIHLFDSTGVFFHPEEQVETNSTTDVPLRAMEFSKANRLHFHPADLIQKQKFLPPGIFQIMNTFPAENLGELPQTSVVPIDAKYPVPTLIFRPGVFRRSESEVGGGKRRSSGRSNAKGLCVALIIQKSLTGKASHPVHIWPEKMAKEGGFTGPDGPLQK